MGTIKTTNIEPIANNGTVTLGSSGDTITIPSGATLDLSSATQTGVGGVNTPAFEAQVGSTQVPSNDTNTKIQFNSETFDTDNCYDNSTNYRFTPTVSGKYFVYTKVRFQSGTASELADTGLLIYKNGSLEIETFTLFRNNYEQAHTVTAYGIIDMNGSSDYLEVYGKLRVNSGSLEGFIGGSKQSTFGAYKIIE